MAPQIAKTQPPGNDAQGGLCCSPLRTKEHGYIANMKTWPQHADVIDRQLALARALPKNGMWTMHNQPFDAEHFAEPAIAGVDLSTTPLKRAIYDRSRLALIVSTRPAKSAAAAGGFTIINLLPAKTYTLSIDGKMVSKLNGVKEYQVTLDGAKAHDLILNQNQP